MEYTGERLLTEIFNQSTIEHIHRYAFALQYVKNKVVVDIASGEGYGSHLLSFDAKMVTGIDISEEAIEHSKKKYQKDNLYYMQGSADKMPIESNSIDIVVSFETIEHHDKHQEMMDEIKRILKPDGLLIISSPDKMYYSDLPKYTNEYHVKELYSEDFQDLIRSNFTHSVFLNQKVNYCSLIISNEKVNFYEFLGDFNLIEKNEGITKSIFNIAVASKNKIDVVFSSSFNGDKYYKMIFEGYYASNYYKKQIDEILNSKTYKLGKYFATPYAKFKKIFNA